MIGFLFPGQGSQQSGMGTPWFDHPSFELAEEASNIIDRDMIWLLTEASQDELQMTRNTQVSTFLMSMIVLDAIERVGVAPQICAGHSLGEYAALVAAGGISFESALLLVQERGEAMAFAAESTPGAMIALLGMGIEQAKAICESFNGDLWIANHNSETQIVLSGTLEAVAEIETNGRAYGIKRTTRLKVGGAFHSPYMITARQRLEKAISSTRLYDLEIPVIANVDAAEHWQASEWAGLLAKQLTNPVQWDSTVRHLRELQPRLLVEVGPGGVLTNLNRRSAPDLASISVSTPQDLETLLGAVTSHGPLSEWATSHHGERLYGSERLIVAPTSGVFTPNPEIAREGALIKVGEEIGTVSATPVRSAFAGSLQGMIAVAGERVTVGQPIAWLRVPDGAVNG